MSSQNKRLQELRDTMNSAKTKIDQLSGKIDGYTEQLQGFECSNTQEAKKLLKKMDKNIQKEEEEFEEGLAKLEKLLTSKGE